MKIFVDAHFLDGRKHGAANFLERLYSQYMEISSDHDFYFGLEVSSTEDYAIFHKPRVHLVRYRFGGSLRFLIDIPLLAISIKPDIIHTQYVIPLRLGYSAKRHVTLFDVLYEDFPNLFDFSYRWFRSLIFGMSVRHADMISTCSDYSRNRIRAKYKPKLEMIHVINGGVMDYSSDENFVIEATSDDFLLYVSRFEKRKNHLFLLEAFLIVLTRYPTFKLILVGFEVDSSYHECKKFIELHNLKEKVYIVSNISDSRIINLYKNANVVVYPSLCEGFGMPIIESLLLNPNTIFSNTTAMSDFTFASRNTFHPEKLENMVDIIFSKIDGSEVDLIEWEKQRILIADKFNWKRSAEVLKSIHDSSLNTKL